MARTTARSAVWLILFAASITLSQAAVVSNWTTSPGVYTTPPESTSSSSVPYYTGNDSLTSIVVVLGVFILLLVVTVIVLFVWVRRKLRALHIENQVLQQDVLMLKEQQAVYHHSPPDNGYTDTVIINHGSDDSPSVQAPEIYFLEENNLGLSLLTPTVPYQRGIPRYSINFEDQEFNAYTGPVGSQLYPICESIILEDSAFGAAHEKRATVQEVEIVPLYSDTYKHKLTVRQPEHGGPVLRPKSIMVDKSLPAASAAGLTQPFPGMFVEKTIGPTGGIISFCGVQIKIPAGAIGEDQNIRIGILTDKAYFPNLSPKECLLSPVVTCTPHGLTFKIPAELTIPHCAQSLTQDWNFHIQKSETEIDQPVQWKNLTLDDVESRSVTDDVVALKIKHFTLYTVVGESADQKVAAKKVTLVAFAPPLKSDSFFKIRVYCVNHYKEEEKELIETSEASLGGALADSPKPLLFRDGGADLCINITNIGPKGWSLIQGEAIEELSFEEVWHTLLPNCSFTLKSDGTLEEVMCTLRGYQKGYEMHQQKIHVSQRQQKAIARTGSVPGDTVFPPELRRQLIIHLDPPDILHGRDWHALAEVLKLRYVDIRWLESKEGTTGPTEYLLQQWDKQKKSLQEFKKVMINIKRPDIVQEIEDFTRSHNA